MQCTLYKFHNKMKSAHVQVHFNRYFIRKNHLLDPGLEPTTLRLLSPCQAIIFLLGIFNSLINQFAPISSQYSGGPSRCH